MNISGRDASQNKKDRETAAFKQYENDIFLKYDESPGSSSMSIRENQIGMHTKDGNVGLLIKSNGNILVQGKLIFKTYGNNIVKGPYTENPLSFIPSTVYTQIPQLLFRFPNVGLIMDVMNKFSEFTKLFQ